METLGIRTPDRECLIDITSQVVRIVDRWAAEEGICHVFVPHTTAGVTINENADPSVRRDILMALARAVPDSLPYTHDEGNSPAHVKASLVGSSVSVFIEGGRLRLGTWQGIFLGEFDGPRQRQVLVKIISG